MIRKKTSLRAAQRDLQLLRLLASLANVPTLDSLRTRQRRSLERQTKRAIFDWEALVYGHAVIHSTLNTLLQEREPQSASKGVNMEELEKRITGKGVSVFLTADNKPMWSRNQDALPETLLVEFRSVIRRDPFPFRRCEARECSTIFVLREQREKYCSARCRTRGDETRHHKKNAYLRTYMAQRRAAARNRPSS